MGAAQNGVLEPVQDAIVAAYDIRERTMSRGSHEMKLYLTPSPVRTLCAALPAAAKHGRAVSPTTSRGVRDDATIDYDIEFFPASKGRILSVILRVGRSVDDPRCCEVIFAASHVNADLEFRGHHYKRHSSIMINSITKHLSHIYSEQAKNSPKPKRCLFTIDPFLKSEYLYLNHTPPLNMHPVFRSGARALITGGKSAPSPIQSHSHNSRLYPSE